MSINKKTLLGRTPDELGTKDAVHVAIVSLRAAKTLLPAQRITLNENREAIPTSDKKKSFGITDPFRDDKVLRGEVFWAILDMNEIPNVRHDWDHPEYNFTPPTVEKSKNKRLASYADRIKVTYDEFIAACEKCVETGVRTPYSGPLTEAELEDALDDRYDIWSEWSDEFLYEFDNNGSECCPEYDYPDCPFKFVEAKKED